MKSMRIIISVLMINMLLCTSVFAYSTSFTNPDSSNWDSPATGALEAYKIENKLLSIKASIQWTSDQIKQFQSKNIFKQFYPALVFKADPSDELRSKIMFTNLPGAKFTRYEASNNSGEEIKVSILNTSDIDADKAYDFYTAWLHTGSGNPVVTFQSLQGYAQPNGTLNDLSKTDDNISTVYMNEGKTLDKKYQDLHLPESFDSPLNQYDVIESRKMKKKIKSYSIIDSKEALDQYKINAAKLVKAVSDEEEKQFAITFKKNAVYYGDLDRFAQEYNLSISQIYAAGYANNNLGTPDKTEEFTVSWFDTKNREYSLLNMGNRLGFGEFWLTELEGKAKGEDLKRISNIPGVDVIDIEENGRIPTGVHWLNTRYEK